MHARQRPIVLKHMRSIYIIPNGLALFVNVMLLWGTRKDSVATIVVLCLDDEMTLSRVAIGSIGMSLIWYI